jgi:hypothetical protein
MTADEEWVGLDPTSAQYLQQSKLWPIVDAATGRWLLAAASAELQARVLAEHSRAVGSPNPGQADASRSAPGPSGSASRGETSSPVGLTD